MTRTSTREANINIRVMPADRALIDRAAEVAGKTAPSS
jgi:uncharacterized protein (DUF1778 family)